MAATPGICAKTTTCGVARAGRILAIPLGESFVCPECGSALVSPAQATVAPPLAAGARVPFLMPMVAAGAGLFLLGGALFVGHEIGQVAAPPSPVVVAAVVRSPAAPPPNPVPALLPQAPPSVATKLPVVAVTPPAGPPAPAVATAAIPHADPQTAPMSAAPSTVSPPGVTFATVAPTVVAPTVVGPTVVASAAVAPRVVAPQPAAVPKVAAPVALAAVATPPPEAAAPLLPDAPFSPAPEAGGAPAYPSELAADGKIGHVAVTCQIQADGAPVACRAGARSSGAAFSASVLAWLNHGHVRFHPVVLHGKPVVATRSWVVTVEETPAALADSRRKQREAAVLAAAEPPAAPVVAPVAAAPKVQRVAARQAIPEAAVRTGVDRPFSTHVVAGGAPVFPPYYDEGRPGAVSVSCMISAAGVPSGCHTARVMGGSGFGKAVLTWLGSGSVRFRPMLADGQPVGHEETWTVVFNQMPVAAYPE